MSTNVVKFKTQFKELPEILVAPLKNRNLVGEHYNGGYNGAEFDIMIQKKSKTGFTIVDKEHGYIANAPDFNSTIINIGWMACGIKDAGI
jgi:hypothetical protein